MAIGLLIISTMVEAANCTGIVGGAGMKVVGVDGNDYCRSKMTMNWWSAFAWCEGMGMKLISLEDCNGSDGSLAPTESDCPNFAGTGTVSVWTASVPNSYNAYSVYLSNGSITYSNDPGSKYRANDRSYYALCKK